MADSGGHELAHQCCHQICEFGYDAKMYYVEAGIGQPVDVEAPSKFEKYNTAHVIDFSEVDECGNVVIVPEGLADWAFLFDKASVIMWWMSVDNYLFYGNEDATRDLIDITKIHLVQSEYARQYVKGLGVEASNIMWLSDYIGDVYGQFILPTEYRKNRIIYNPRKGYKDIKPLIDICQDIEWIPLVNMTEEEMVLNMQLSKLYIDFGHHPGKDRIPREAALCGCCIITNTCGSAAYYEDIPIDSKYKCQLPIDYDEVSILVHDVINNYSQCFMDFEEYREKIRTEKELFINDIQYLIKKSLFF